MQWKRWLQGFGFTFDDAQSVFLSWMKRLAWVIENGGGHYREYKRFCMLMLMFNKWEI
jgi:hypothetical protein